ncbi:MAG: SMC-Scp complex subunit ScpB [Candidatus Paceibacterota bacterium]
MNQLTAKIESLLFYTQEAMSVKEIAKLCGESAGEVETALAKLKEKLAESGLALVTTDKSAQLVTSPNFSDFISEIREEEINTDLTEAQSEALATVAYLAPVQKVRIDFIRGVNSRAVLRNLSVRGLVSRRTADGVSTYDLTPEALAHLGITEKKELPDYEETREKLEAFSEPEEPSLEVEE